MINMLLSDFHQLECEYLNMKLHLSNEQIPILPIDNLKKNFRALHSIVRSKNATFQHRVPYENSEAFSKLSP